MSASLVGVLRAVDAHLLKGLAETGAGPKPAIGTAPREEEEHGSLGSDPEQALPQVEKVIEIGCYTMAYWNQPVFEELRGLNK